jgi:hypothetical protein
MRTVKLFLATLVAGLFALPALAQAQSNKAQVYHVEAKPGFEEAVERHAEWRAEQGDPWEWDVYEVVQGKHYGDYVIRSGGHDWSDWDSYNEGFGQRGGERFEANVGEYVENMKAYVEAVDTTLVRWPDEMDARLVSVETYYLEPGHAQDWWEVAEAFHEAITQEDAAGYRYALSRPAAGSSGWARVVTPHANWADFAPPERQGDELMSAVHGEEETEEMFERFGNSFHSSSSMVLRHRPDLSVDAGDEMEGDRSGS